MFFLLILVTIFIISFATIAYCGDPTIINKLNSALKKITEWMIKLATPAAAVAIGTGIFITKFSFGDEDRIMKGKKLIRTTLFSYGFILAVDLILKAIQSLIG